MRLIGSRGFSDFLELMKNIQYNNQYQYRWSLIDI